MRLPRLASITAAAAAAGLAAFAAAPSAQAAAHPAGSAAVTPTVISSVPMLPGVNAGGGQGDGAGVNVTGGDGADAAQDGPGHPGARRVWLTLSLSGPMFDDHDGMSYSLAVVNSRLSPDTATGLVVRTTLLECTRQDEPGVFCAHERPAYEHLGALAPGQAYHGSLPIALPDNDSALYLRFTAELVHVDELTPGATPGTCSHGLHPSDLCASTDYTLLP